MTTRMWSKMKVIDARLFVVESSLKNQESMVLSHDTTLKEHSVLLAEITKTLTLVQIEIWEGFQHQYQGNGGKDKQDSSSGALLEASYEITDDGYKLTSGH